MNDFKCSLHFYQGISKSSSRSVVGQLAFVNHSLSLSLQEGEMWFSEELFLDHKSSSMRQFLQSAIHLQSFKQVHTVPHSVYCPLLDTCCNYNTGGGLAGQTGTVK